eukprot:2925278-Amphidinium_carterae.1
MITTGSHCFSLRTHERYVERFTASSPPNNRAKVFQSLLEVAPTAVAFSPTYGATFPHWWILEERSRSHN